MTQTKDTKPKTSAEENLSLKEMHDRQALIKAECQRLWGVAGQLQYEKEIKTGDLKNVNLTIARLSMDYTELQKLIADHPDTASNVTPIQAEAVK